MRPHLKITIKDAALWRYRLPFAALPPRMPPEVRCRDGLILALADESGRKHYGEVAPLPQVHPESVDEAGAYLSTILPDLRGITLDLGSFDPFAVSFALLPREKHTAMPTSVHFGWEQALMGLLCSHGDLAMYRQHAALVASWRQPSFPLRNTLLHAWDHPVPALRHEGAVVKVKIGLLAASQECSLILDLLRSLPRDARLRLDGNRAFNPDDLDRFWQLCAAHAITERIAYLEEPLQRTSDYAQLKPGIPIALDESLWDQEPQIFPFCRHYILKPTRLGGISGTLRWIAAIQSGAALPILSSCYESSLSLLTYARLIHGAGLDGIPMGLGSHAYLTDDLIEPAYTLHSGCNIISAPQTSPRLNENRLVATIMPWEEDYDAG